jgi:PmbA protein
MERKEYLEKVLTYGRQEGFDACEVFYRGGRAFEVLIMEGEVSNYENSKEEGLAFRGNIGGRTGYAYTEQLTEDAIPFLVNMAKENAALLSPEDVEDLYEGEESYPELEGVNEELEQLAAQ